MPAIAATSLPIDNETPQGTVAFNPVNIDANGVARFQTAEGVYDARQQLTQSLRLPSKVSKVARLQVKLSIPIMDEDVPTTKVGDMLATIEVVVPKSATQAQRDQLAIELYALAGNGLVYAAIQNLAPLY